MKNLFVHGVIALLSLLASSPSWSEDSWPNTSSTRSLPFGMLGSVDAATATDDTLEALYSLDHFQALPDHPTFYFSAGASDTGTVAAGSAANTLVATAEAWTADQFTGQSVRILTGTGIGQTRKIVENGTTTLTIGNAWSVIPANLDTFDIYSGELVPGVDTNPGTMDAPFRSITQANLLMVDGGPMHRIWDTDRWLTYGATTDWGTDKGLLIPDAKSCVGNEDVCLVDSGIDFTGATRPLFDCLNVTSPIQDGIWQDLRATVQSGWWLVQNFRTENCPNTDTTGQDIIQAGFSGPAARTVFLNIDVPRAQGANNSIYEVHGGMHTAINVTGSFRVGSASDGYVFNLITGDALFISRSRFVTSDVPTTTAKVFVLNPQSQGTSTSSNMTIIGPTLFSAVGATNASQIVAIQTDLSNLNYTSATLTLIDTFLYGASSATGIGIMIEPDYADFLVNLRMFRTTLADNRYSIIGQNQTADPPADGISVRVYGRCVLMDEYPATHSIMTINNTGAAESAWDFNIEGITDDDETANSFFMGTQGNIGDLAGVQALTTPNAGAGFTNFFETGINFDSGAGADGNQFGTPGTTVGQCDDDMECWKACTTQWIEPFTNGLYIPKAVLGAKIVGLSLNTSSASPQNIGAK